MATRWTAGWVTEYSGKAFIWGCNMKDGDRWLNTCAAPTIEELKQLLRNCHINSEDGSFIPVEFEYGD